MAVGTERAISGASRGPAITGSSESTAESRPSGFRADVQGLRAIAVASVMLYHAGIPGVSGGYVGVDIFFVISGFLITGHLLRDLLANGRISFGSFYARRARRILPAAFAVNAATLAAAIALVPPTELTSAARDAIATALYVPNMLFAGRATDYLAQSGPPSLYQHFWSLGVEEQFYLLWPLVLLAGFALVRHRRALLGLAMCGVAASSFAACVWLTASDEPVAFFTLPTRAWEFAAGGLVALAVTGERRLPAPAGTLLTWAGLAGLGFAIFGFTERTAFPGSAAALPVAGTALVILGGTRAAGVTGAAPSRLLGTAPMVFVGEISYALYLVHWPILTIAGYAHLGPLPLWYRVVLLAACVPAAYLVYRLVENPVRRSRRLARTRPLVSLAGGLACSLALVIAAVGTGASTAGAAMSAGKPASGPVVEVDPTGTAYVPSNLEPSLADAGQDNPASYADGCHRSVEYTAPAPNCTFGTNADAPLVVLFGDSHAAEWFPALEPLADAGKIRLESDTKSGCPSAEIDVDYISGTGPQPYPECLVWRQAVLDRLAAAPPAMVILSNFNHPNLPSGGYPTPAAWSAAIKATIAKIPATTTVVVLGETPLPGITPADCLAAHLTNATACDVSRSDALNPAMETGERKATKAAGADYVDLSRYMCNSSECPPIIGNVLVYRDNQHLTATYAQALEPVLAPKIDEALASG